ncbi:MAG: alpha/beta hydrolase [Actinobacteria bacterium]|nr:alpha/beta hydrolase [Actinomycetota bacterium]
MWHGGAFMRLPAAVAAAPCVAVFTVLVTACASGVVDEARPRTTTTTSRATTTTSGASPVGPLVWHDCDEGECATLSVPRDHDKPDGDQVELAVARGSQADPEARIGSLLVNPGGPGADGTEWAEYFASLFPNEVTDRFDVVAWDPRGSGDSAPVDCGDRLDYLFEPDSAPDDPAEQEALETAAARFAAECEARSGDWLANISSQDTVRDMDLLRQALGDEQLTYVGFSYGTYLGALYAQAYPDRVRALILDGAVDPSVPAEDVGIEQAQGFDRALQAFLDDCAADDDCAFHHDGDPRGGLEALRARTERGEIRADDRRVLGPTHLDLALASPLYEGAPAYDDLAEALRDAERGDPSALLDEFDVYVGRSSDGTYDAEWPAFLAISCIDVPQLSVTEMREAQARATIASPDFGAANTGLGYPCSFWPVPAVTATTGPVRAPGAAPIMVIGTTGDPATPVEWSESLARQLGSGRLVVVEGSTHTSLLDGPRCLEDLAIRYLVDLEPPPEGARC